MSTSARGIASLTGATYGDDAALVYAFYQGLKPVDVIYGVVLVLLAVATIAVRQELAHFKKDGPLHYLVLIGANIVIALVHLIALAAVTGLGIGDLADSSTWGSMFASAVLIVVNYLYFGKRKHLFLQLGAGMETERYKFFNHAACESIRATTCPLRS